MKRSRLFTRRNFLGLLSKTGIFMLLGSPVKWSFGSTNYKTQEERTLSVLLNTLIPSDETPGATELGVDKDIRTKMEKEPSYKKLVREGCNWLNNRAVERGSESFVALNETQRNYFVTLASSGKNNSLERVFFSNIRNDAFFYYYSHPTTWSALRYPGPPQPWGFKDYVNPPNMTNSAPK